MKIAIALRTCDSVLNYWNTERIIDCSKPVLLLTCLNSLLKSISYDLRHSSDEIKFSIHDAMSSKDTRDKILKLANEYKIDIDWYDCELLGNFISQYLWCKEQDCDYLYCVEDDYLHTFSAIKDMRDGVEYFNDFFPGDYAVHPFNSPHRYTCYDMLYPSFILKGPNQYWRSSFHSTHTFFIPKKSFIDYDYIMRKQAMNFPYCNEDNSINIVWKEQKTRLISPLQSLAFHISDKTQEDPFYDWKMLWKQNSISSCLKDI